MKKLKYILLLLSIISFDQIFACDICGCGNNGAYIGILPEFQKNILGIRYRNNSIKTHIGNNGMSTYLTTTETYSAYEFWGSTRLSKKINLQFTLPYNVNERTNNIEKETITGLGDVNLMGYYTVLESNKLTSANKVIIQSMRVSIGLKLPTGKYKMNENVSSSQLFTLGTGTLDFNLSGVYEARLQNTGINLSANMKINSSNKDAYKYGNKFQFNAQIYQKIFINSNFSIAPNAGLQFEKNRKDVDKQEIVDISGGNLLNGSAGAELKMKNLLLGFNYQSPISQNIGNSMIAARDRSMIHLSYLF
jgi:hypothetical protein